MDIQGNPIQKWIVLSGGKKILNPLLSATNFSYQGPIDDYDFGSMRSNYDKLNKSLYDFDIKLEEIIVGKFTRPRTNSTGTVFVAYNGDRSFVWHKYDAISEGSGNNFIYIKGKKHKLTDFITYTKEELRELFEKK